MRYLYLILITLLFENLYAQDLGKKLIELDALVGTKIDLTEKKKYVIFEFVDTLNYKFSEVYTLRDSSYLLKVFYANGTVVDTILSNVVIENYKENISYMASYYNALNKQRNTAKIVEPNLIKINTIVYNELQTVNYNKHKRIKIKKGKYYHFKINPKNLKTNFSYNPLDIDEKFRYYKYAKVKYINLQDSIIGIKVKDVNFNETFYVKITDIQAIKQNTFESALKKSMGFPNFFLINPFIIVYTPPILLYNLIFKMKRFDFSNDSDFSFIER